ncbi:MAG TPA: NAD-dependent epimerase/dehydratase family protein [bacterium]|nr:NAD-dependent epimerase/dehydratase family protein [bacterium]
MKAIVLGATGFIGSHVARSLAQEGIDVRVLSRGTSPSLALEGLHVERVMGDLDDKKSLIQGMKGCQALFHVAGYYPLYSLNRKPQKRTALAQMTNVLEAAAEAGVEKTVYTSSMSAIGKTADGSPSDEDTPYDTNYFKGLYYEIKYLQEQLALEAARKGRHIVVVNPTGVFGDYDVKPTSGALIVALAKAQVPFLFDALMNAVDAGDVGRGQVAALKQGRSGRRYLLGGHNTTVWELAQKVCRIAKVRMPFGRLPLFVGEVLAMVSEVVGDFFNRPKPLLPQVGIDFLKYGMHYDTSRARKELGFTATPLEETLERAIAWFRKHRYL